MSRVSYDVAYGLIKDYLALLDRPTIIELGMCDGGETRMLLSHCKSNPIYHGFEPDPRNVDNIRKGDLPSKITFHAAAMGNVTGMVAFNMATPEPGGMVGSSSLSEFTPVLMQCFPWLKVQNTVQVHSWRLDDFCAVNNIKAIDFMWMDVQGAERLVFDGGPLMFPKVRMLWTEYDACSFYKDSSPLQAVLDRFPGWAVLADTGGDVLLMNPNAA